MLLQGPGQLKCFRGGYSIVMRQSNQALTLQVFCQGDVIDMRHRQAKGMPCYNDNGSGENTGLTWNWKCLEDQSQSH